MGVDIYMEWDGKTKEDQEKQYTGMISTGSVGYLRGAYFGGYSDVLMLLFDWLPRWNDGESYPFDPDAFEAALQELKQAGGERPGKGKWDDHPDGGFKDRQNEPVQPDEFKEYDAFLAFGRKLKDEGKNPKVYVSA